MNAGYMGKVLFVDLTQRKTWTEPLPEEWARRFIGGSGLGARYLVELSDPRVDPLGPENPLIFMNGPWTATPIPLSGRHEVVAKSPLTGIYGEADAGGHWGTALKKAGYDGVVVLGASEEPVYLWIHEEGVEIRDASHLWGLDTYVADEQLRAETAKNAVTCAIGPAGENLVKIAAVMHDGRDARPAARCGLGAVMGAKKLKALVAIGNRRPPIRDREALMASIKAAVPEIKRLAESLSKYGTSGRMTTIEALGDLPIRNWVQGAWKEGAERISGQRMAETILKKQYFCGACVIGCGRDVEITQGPYAGVHGAGPEYEALACLGALTVVDDLEALAYATELCNRLGMDVISTGGVIAFAIECAERGLLPPKVDGVELRWGSPEVVLTLIKQIARRQGLGALLAEGVRKASEDIGGLALEFAIHAKGLELPAHDPRAYNSLAVGYATSNRGACHLQGFSYIFERSVTLPELGYPEVQDRFGVEGKGQFVAVTQDLMCLFDSLKTCKFILFGGIKPTHLLEWFNLVNGWGWDLDRFMEAGERIFNLKRLYNVACGISRKDDTIAPRILTQRRGEGGAATNLPPFGEILSQYYEHRGWSPEGIPTEETVRRLGLEEEARKLWAKAMVKV